MRSQSIELPAFNTLTIVADAITAGTLARIADSAGSADGYGVAAIAAASTTVIGPFTSPRRYLLTTDTGAFTVTLAVAQGAPLGAVGFVTGQGGAVTQITTRATGVTVNAICGTITTDTTSLDAEAAAEFTVTNSQVAIGDVVVVAIQSGTNGGNTAVAVTTVADGSFKLKVSNNNADAGTAETGAILINFAVIKAVSV